MASLARGIIVDSGMKPTGAGYGHMNMARILLILNPDIQIGRVAAFLAPTNWTIHSRLPVYC